MTGTAESAPNVYVKEITCEQCEKDRDLSHAIVTGENVHAFGTGTEMTSKKICACAWPQRIMR